MKPFDSLGYYIGILKDYLYPAPKLPVQRTAAQINIPDFTIMVASQLLFTASPSPTRSELALAGFGRDRHEGGIAD